MVVRRQALIWLSPTEVVTWILLLSGPQYSHLQNGMGLVSTSQGGLDLLIVSDLRTVTYFLGPLLACL